MENKTEIIFGPPGTGKTTTLLNIMEQELESGLSSKQLAFVSFTKKAASEAVERACERFGFISPRVQLPYFRTLHSMAYLGLKLRQDDVFNWDHTKELSQITGVKVTGKQVEDIEEAEDGGQGVAEGDQYLFVYGLARSSRVSLEDMWHEYPDLSWYGLKSFVDHYEDYKEQRGLLDFTDFILRFLDRGIRVPVSVVIIDEAQDLSTIQWEMAHVLMEDAERVYVAGDDDQAIFEWSGADINHFMNLPGKKRVLEKSWRLPSNIWDVGNKITRQIENRVRKDWSPHKEGGEILKYMHIHQLDFNEYSGDWLILVRNKVFLSQFVQHCRDSGMIYSTSQYETSIKARHLLAIQTWERLRASYPAKKGDVKTMLQFYRGKQRTVLPEGSDAETQITQDQLAHLPWNNLWHDALNAMPANDRIYYLEILRGGRKLTDTPRVKLSTIHGVKGGEADNVVVCMDMGYRTYNEFSNRPESEHRVFYVAVTRAKKTLHLMDPLPQSTRFYNIPGV